MFKKTAVPLGALLTSAALAILMAEQTTLACTDKVAVPMPGDMMMASMPGMTMGTMPMGQPAMMVCPVVLALAVASALLAALAVAMLWLDPHRGLTQRAILHALSGLPPVRTAGVVALAGGGAVGAMMWLERSGLPALPICGMLMALLIACAVAATFVAIVAGRIALAFGRRLILAIAAAIAAADNFSAPRQRRFAPIAACGRDIPLLAAGRGLRAPPARVR